MENEATKPAEASTRSAGAAKKKAKPAKREASSIVFPYRNLELGISVAQAMLGAGGVALSTEQLAGVLNLQAGSGNFVMKVATARIFGLIANNQGKYELTNTGFEIVDKDEKRQRAARAAAFLSVPLYRRVYDEFRGRQLPPRPHGLEQAFIKFGVSPKQKQPARLAFDKSAAEAGFFSTGNDRLVEPIIGVVTPLDRRTPSEDDTTMDDDQDQQTYNAGKYHPFIQGLLDTLPEPDTNWTVEGRAKWLQAAAHNFDLIYKGSGVINITAKSDEPTKA